MNAYVVYFEGEPRTIYSDAPDVQGAVYEYFQRKAEALENEAIAWIQAKDLPEDQRIKVEMSISISVTVVTA